MPSRAGTPQRRRSSGRAMSGPSVRLRHGGGPIRPTGKEFGEASGTGRMLGDTAFGSVGCRDAPRNRPSKSRGYLRRAQACASMGTSIYPDFFTLRNGILNATRLLKFKIFAKCGILRLPHARIPAYLTSAPRGLSAAQASPASSRSERNRSASSAAMQPIPAEVTACRYTGSAMSPAAKTPGIEVSALPGLVAT